MPTEPTEPTGTPNHGARLLHDAYVAKINAAIASGRDDLVAELAENYRQDSRRA
ncbi:hypothetical protein ABCR94_11270 [Streptomyces sp. 21So2-11]|uniref:hypothetical protein n=1 Tax=Streptomyces sp. 21So2-11 TaxID=3144408 RepID=UPI00321B8ECE